MVLTLCVGLCACSAQPNADAENATETTAETTQSVKPTETEEEPVGTTIEFEEPIVILDNEHIKLQVVAKCDAEVIGQDNTLGYIAQIENKSDSQYVMVIVHSANVDGYMLTGGLALKNDNVLAPGTKCNNYLYLYCDRDPLLELESLDDLVNVDGLVQLSFSDDGITYDDFCDFSFENVIP